MSFANASDEGSVKEETTEQADDSIPPPPANLDDFFQRYPVDERAQQYLTSSGPEVVAQCLAKFKPPREGDADYTTLLMSYVKRLRTENGFAGHAGHLWSSKQHHVAQGGLEEDQISLQVDVAKFCDRYPIDEDAYNYLMNSPIGVQERVLREFHPKREGDTDYSAIVLSFTKRCRMQSSQPPAAHPSHRPAVYTIYADSRPALGPCHSTGVSSRGHAFHSSIHSPGIHGSPHHGPGVHGYSMHGPSGHGPPVHNVGGPARGTHALLGSYGPGPGAGPAPGPSLGAGHTLRRQSAVFGTDAGPPLTTPTQEILDSFFLQYPVDARAQEYFGESSLAVQHKVMQEFKPPREGDIDYTQIFMSFVKRCRNEELTSQRFAQRASPGQQDGGEHSYITRGSNVPNLESFRHRYPMDDRAYASLCAAHPEVRDMVVTTFVPPRHDDSDYSAPVMAYLRKCRDAVGPGYSCNHGPPPPPALSVAASWRGHHNQGAQALEQAVHDFCMRFPVDDRTVEYLKSSPPDVISRVLREFKPKIEGEADYTRLVMAFTKNCRAQATIPVPHWEPPPKYPRLY